MSLNIQNINQHQLQKNFFDLAIVTIPIHLIISLTKICARIMQMAKYTFGYQRIENYSYLKDSLRIITAFPSIVPYQIAAIVGCFNPEKGIRWLNSINKFELNGLGFSHLQLTNQMVGFKEEFNSSDRIDNQLSGSSIDQPLTSNDIVDHTRVIDQQIAFDVSVNEGERS